VESKEIPILAFESAAAFEAWLEAHENEQAGLWLRIAKKDSGLPTVTYDQALDAALCFGWIDGQKGKGDETTWLQRFLPRRPRSGWSKVNREKVERLITEGRMREGGQRQIDAAKADGRWDAAYDPQSKATVPEDLQEALDANPKAAAFFLTLKSANRYAILYRIQTAKKAETRSTRIATIVGMLERGETFHPQ